MRFKIKKNNMLTVYFNPALEINPLIPENFYCA